MALFCARAEVCFVCKYKLAVKAVQHPVAIWCFKVETYETFCVMGA